MNKLIFIGMLGIASMVGCANQQQAPEPQTGPPGAEIENQDREESAKSKPTEPEASDTKPAKADESSGVTDEPTKKSAPEKKSCAGLKKSACEVTVGCAWSTDKVCLNQ